MHIHSVQYFEPLKCLLFILDYLSHYLFEKFMCRLSMCSHSASPQYFTMILLCHLCPVQHLCKQSVCVLYQHLHIHHVPAKCFYVFIIKGCSGILKSILMIASYSDPNVYLVHPTQRSHKVILNE